MNLNRLHSLVFWIFLLLFLATSASVLFFTFGYRFSFNRGIFVYTGSITVKSNPRTANISLDGEPVLNDMLHNINQTSHITGVAPGEHRIRIEADGFQPWEKKVVVQSGISTEFWNILLPRSSYETTGLFEGPIMKVFPSSTRKYFSTLGERDGETTLTVIERKTGLSTQIFSSRDYRFDPDDGRNVEWSKDEDSFLIPLRLRTSNERTVFIVDRLTRTATNLRDIASVPDPENPRWHPDNDGTFFVFSQGSLLLVRPEMKTAEDRTLIVASDILAYDLSGQYATVLEREDGSIARIPFGAPNNTKPESVTGPIPGADHFQKPFLTSYDDKRIALFDRHGSGFLWNDDGELEPSLISIGSGIEGVQFSDDGKKLLFFTRDEVSVAFTRDWDVQPSRKKGEILQVTRFSSPLSEVQWSKDYEHVLFTLGSELKMVELDNRDRRNIDTIIPQSERTLRQVIPLPSENELYTVSQPESSDMTTLSFIRFPEPVGIFGQ
jgi:hypothetical protein